MKPENTHIDKIKRRRPHQHKDRITIEEALELLPGRFQAGARAAFRAIDTDDKRKYMHGAALVSGRRVFSTGRNSYKTNPNDSSKYQTLHAETHMLLNSPHNECDNMVCFVVRVSKTHNFITTSRPCDTCRALLKEHNIQSVVYTTIDGWKIEKL